jgi:pyrroline-5-carboxylate reductase
MLAGKKIAVIGAGNMGRSLLSGLGKSEAAAGARINAYDLKPAAVKAADKAMAKLLVKDLKAALADAALVALAVKPQDMDDLLAKIKSLVSTDDPTWLSVAAGVSTARIEAGLGGDARVIRSMPNIGALYGHGVTAVTRGAHAADRDLKLAVAVMGTVGSVVEVKEDLMDAVTGVSGSGPAYVFLFIEALIEAGVAQGLSRDVARILAGETVRGAAEIFVRDPRHPAELKDLVTSPGGTTVAALAALESTGFRGIIIEAVGAATKRSRELGQK